MAKDHDDPDNLITPQHVKIPGQKRLQGGAPVRER